MAVRLVLTTCPDEDTAGHIARELVERRLAACVTRLAGARSVYRWRERLEEDAEVQLLIKTTEERVPALVAALRALHPYEEPECIAVPVTEGGEGYLGWIETSVGGDSR